MSDNEPFEVVDSSGLTDADWAEINRLQRVYKEGGKEALNEAMAALAKDPIGFIRVVGAFFPDMIKKMIHDALDQEGISEEDLRETLAEIEDRGQRH